MITWTDSARALLDRHNETMRQQLLANGADPDEVAADLHRHIEEELNAAKIHVATRDDVQRVLSRMGETLPDPPALQPRTKPVWKKVWPPLLGLAAGIAIVLVYRGYRANSGNVFVGTDSLTSITPAYQDNEFPFVIEFASSTPRWGPFAPGDGIAITGIKGDRKKIEPGGRYLVAGSYTLASMESARLAISVTAPVGTPPGPFNCTTVPRGTGHFKLLGSMANPGAFHVSFYPIGGGESHGTVYFEAIADPQKKRMD